MHRGSIGPSSDQVTRVAFEPQAAVTRAAQWHALHLASLDRELGRPKLASARGGAGTSRGCRPHADLLAPLLFVRIADNEEVAIEILR